MNNNLVLNSPLVPNIFWHTERGDGYITKGFKRYPERSEYNYHPSLPYGLIAGGDVGAVLHGGEWHGVVVFNILTFNVMTLNKAYRTAIVPPIVADKVKKIPSARHCDARDDVMLALRDAYDLALASGVLVKLNIPYCVGEQLIVTYIPDNDKSFPFQLLTLVTVREDFMVEGELYFRVADKAGVEHYLPAACTNYLSPEYRC